MKRSLLLVSTVCLFSLGATAQNYAPAAWTFSKQQQGSAAGFIKEMASTNWNCKAPFRLGDALDGSIGLACAVGGDVTGPGSDLYANVTDADKAVFEEFYKACQIVDGGELGNLFCYQGSASTMSDPRAVKNSKAMPNATMFWLSNTDIPLAANYRVSMGYRVIANSGNNAMKLTLATSAYDGIDNGTDLANGTYRELELPFYADFNDYWSTATMDITIADNTDPNYKELPLVIKMWLGSGIENAIVLFSDIKLEKIETIDNKYVPGKIEDVEWNDSPTGISYIQVYSVSGKLVSFKSPISSVTTIPVAQKGVYIVKIGESCRKIVL